MATSHHAWSVLWCLSGRGEKSTVEFYSSYKNAGLRRVGFGFAGHPALNYSLKASAQVVEFVWIDGEAERVVCKDTRLVCVPAIYPNKKANQRDGVDGAQAACFPPLF